MVETAAGLRKENADGTFTFEYAAFAPVC